MRNFVITIPIDDDLESCVRQIGLRLYSLEKLVTEALTENNPDLLFDCFGGIGNPDLGIEYGFGLEITADKPVAGQRVGDRIEIPELEVMG